jgi:hypothetical protein
VDNHHRADDGACVGRLQLTQAQYHGARGRSTTTYASCAREKRPTVNQHHTAHGTRQRTQQPANGAGRRKSCTTFDANRGGGGAIGREGVAPARSLCVGGRVAITRGQHAVCLLGWFDTVRCVCLPNTNHPHTSPPVWYTTSSPRPQHGAQRLHTTGLLARCGTPGDTLMFGSGGSAHCEPRAETPHHSHVRTPTLNQPITRVGQKTIHACHAAASAVRRSFERSSADGHLVTQRRGEHRA